MKHIGIVACSAEGAALCYRTIAQTGEPCVRENNPPKVPLLVRAEDCPLPVLDSTRLLAEPPCGMRSE